MAMRRTRPTRAGRRARASSTADEVAAERLPPQATMGLLDYLSTHTLDEDYTFVS